MSQVDTLLSEGIGKLEMAQSFEENPQRRKKIAEVIQLAWEIIHSDYENQIGD